MSASRRRPTSIISLLRRYQALAQVHAATSRLQATLGIDPLPDSSDDLSLEQIKHPGAHPACSAAEPWKLTPWPPCSAPSKCWPSSARRCWPPPARRKAPTLNCAPQLTPRRYTTLAAEIGARVQRLTVTEGAVIQEGQVAGSAWTAACKKPSRTAPRATLDAATKQLATQRRLVELNATGRQELDQAEAEVRQDPAPS